MENITQMNDDGTQIIKYSFKTGEKVEVIFDVKTARECDFKHIDSYQFSPDGKKLLIATKTTPDLSALIYSCTLYLPFETK